MTMVMTVMRVMMVMVMMVVKRGVTIIRRR